mmetsp:Transcript_6980/g.13960  ORF Transcript_6980/g.13960 Transcript_6980/m.13960 type:complete len:130 (+) Transcript_6980:211-600(+)|eukprot:CAMPEP_0171491646 /NCGR_PEP_ID=MMETSP0958-20121227/3971_1 /TAXON_ID=87120 /ORGANISM="Aurantiochytrium limacinum, Strain ATCCMYA-1381" /LENGTH=129 /DNA_ID=CAMNT_0012025079 /DNA_START=144 /DNA_END=533 /DNA_ORIENTATION=-
MHPFWATVLAVSVVAFLVYVLCMGPSRAKADAGFAAGATRASVASSSSAGSNTSRSTSGATSASKTQGVAKSRRTADGGSSQQFEIKIQRMNKLKEDARARYRLLHPDFVPPGEATKHAETTAADKKDN